MPLVIDTKKSLLADRIHRRSAGRCTSRVGAFRPTVSRYPAFLSHSVESLGGFRGFSTRTVSRER